MIESSEQAINMLKDTNLSEVEREHAIEYLHEHQTDEGIAILIEALEDDDPGVRWKASEALAAFGESAMPRLLEALCQPSTDQRMREGAWHVLRQNSSHSVRAETQKLQKALKGPSANIASMEEANKLWMKYR